MGRPPGKPSGQTRAPLSQQIGDLRRELRTWVKSHRALARRVGELERALVELQDHQDE